MLLSFLLLCYRIDPAASAAGWDEPNICNGGSGWEVVPDPYKDDHPPKPYDESWKSDDTSIVVLIATLRETRCPATLNSMYDKAKNPKRIFFGVVQQNQHSDVDCQIGACQQRGTPAKKNADGTYSAGECELFDNVRMIRMKASEARGPVFARGHQHLLVEEQDDFCVQIDAHTDVTTNWDRKLLDEWGSLENEYAILTSYPTNVHDLGKNSNKHWEMPILCKGQVIGAGLIRNHQASACANLEKPALSPLWAAGLSFGRCHAERNVPNDMNLKGVFMGEEYARGARLWTNGYDFYCPARPNLGTYYGGEKGGHGHFSTDANDKKVSTSRLTTLLNWPGSDQSEEAHKRLAPYGLGTRRTLEQYNIFSGIDTPKARTRSDFKCTDRVFIPWNTDDAYSEYKTATTTTTTKKTTTTTTTTTKRVEEPKPLKKKINFGVHEDHGPPILPTEEKEINWLRVSGFVGVSIVLVLLFVGKKLKIFDKKVTNPKYSV